MLLSVALTLLAESISLFSSGWPPPIQVWSGSTAIRKIQLKTKMARIRPK